jgi:hypothetical protein
MDLLQCGSPQIGPDPLFAATHASAMEGEKDYRQIWPAQPFLKEYFSCKGRRMPFGAIGWRGSSFFRFPF